MSINVGEIWKEIMVKIRGAQSLKDINDVLDQIHPSDAHVVIRDMFGIATNRTITICKNSKDKLEVAEYQRFQDIKIKAKQSWDHDHTNATMLDVDMAVSKSYGITLRMIKVTNNIADSRFDKLTKAINRIEEHLGLEVTNFKEEDNNDSAKPNDVQGVKENINGAGDTVAEV
jgi:hypothetical protein